MKDTRPGNQSTGVPDVMIAIAIIGVGVLTSLLAILMSL